MNILLAPYQGIPIVLERKIALVITEIIGMTVFCLVKVGNVIKLKTFFSQLFSGNFAFSLWIGF